MATRKRKQPEASKGKERAKRAVAKRGAKGAEDKAPESSERPSIPDVEADAADDPPAEPEPVEDAESSEPAASAEAEPDLAAAEEAGAVGDAQESGDASEGSGEEGEDFQDTEEFLRGLLEALLFVSDRPLTLKELARAARIDKKRTGELLERLLVEHAERGVRIDAVSDGYAFRSHPRYSKYVRNFLAQRPIRLSRAQLETLAIVAYRQPITRPDIDDIRGVDSGPVLKGLLERDLIRILGKKDEPGRPMLYGTTTAFLELFSLTALSELPTLREFTELSDESRRKFEVETGEDAPEGPIDLTADLGDIPRYSDQEGEPDADDAGAESGSSVAVEGEASEVDTGEGSSGEPQSGSAEASDSEVTSDNGSPGSEGSGESDDEDDEDDSDEDDEDDEDDSDEDDEDDEDDDDDS